MCKKCLILLMAGMLIMPAGCGGKEETPDVNEEGIQTEEETAVEDAKEAEEEEVEIELPESEDMKADYTTAAGLELPAGTRIAVIAKSIKSAYWQAVQMGMQKAIDDLNAEAGLTGENQIVMTFEGPDDSDDAETQINTIDAVLAENPQVLCLSAIDMTSCAAQLEAAEENGIPVIMFDSSVRDDELAYTICKTDNYAAGTEAAKNLMAKAGDFGEAVIVASSKSTESIMDRVLGFESELINEYNVKIAEVIYADDQEDTRSMKERLQEVLDNNPNIKGCFATDEAMAKEVLAVLENTEYQDLQFAGFDAGEGQVEAIRQGKELGTVCQNPYGMGYATIISSARAVLGLTNDDVIDAGYQWIDISNIDLEENQKYLYE